MYVYLTGLACWARGDAFVIIQAPVLMGVDYCAAVAATRPASATLKKNATVSLFGVAMWFVKCAVLKRKSIFATKCSGIPKVFTQPDSHGWEPFL